MKYKLINNQTKEEHLCDKVTIDGFDYYVSDSREVKKDFQYVVRTTTSRVYKIRIIDKLLSSEYIVIATNNPNIDIPKVVDDYIRKLAQEYRDKISIQLEYDKPRKVTTALHIECGFYDGYNKSQETHPNSDEDIIEFLDWKEQQGYVFTSDGFAKIGNSKFYTSKELLQLWKEQQPKIVYYE